MTGLKLFISLLLTSLGILFIKIKTEFLVLSLYPASYQSHMILSTWKKTHGLSLGYMLSSVKFCDPFWFYFVYAFDLRFYAQMNLVLLKYCLTIVFKKKREMKRWHAKEAWPQKKKRERKDGMPKKHDPANKTRHEKKHVFICALTLSVVNMSINLWIQSLILQ